MRAGLFGWLRNTTRENAGVEIWWPPDPRERGEHQGEDDDEDTAPAHAVPSLERFRASSARTAEPRNPERESESY